MPNDAYIWQRVWTPALDKAIASSAPLVRSWRVLASEIDAQGHRIIPTIDWQALEQKDTIAVFRIDGRRTLPDTASITTAFAAVQEAGPAVTGIEIDYDCPTSRLADYARFLVELRRQMPLGIRLSITALPTWLSSPQFQIVTRQADEIVLQVHAVQKPGAGLFDAAQAMAWVRELAARTSKPFRVALPAYGTRVTLAASGAIVAVESETPTLAGDPAAHELIAMPAAAASFVQDLQKRPPANLAGIVWFRLPTDADSNAWSLGTWQAVAGGNYRVPVLTASLQTGTDTIVLSNPGDVDGELPATITLGKGCTVGDGANGYTMVQTPGGLHFNRVQSGLLHGHHSRIIGWARCDQERPEVNVEP